MTTNSERRSGFSNPHWKAESTYTEDPFSAGSFRVPVKALNIIWGNDSRFWQQSDLTEEETRLTGFKDGVVLLQVNWIEVTGNLTLSPLKLRDPSTTKYEIYYIVKFKVDAFGWHSVPIKFKVGVDGEEAAVKSIILESYREKHDMWHEIPGGEFSVSKDNVNVEFGMFEVDSDWWKGGMVLAGVKIKPKGTSLL